MELTVGRPSAIAWVLPLLAGVVGGASFGAAGRLFDRQLDVRHTSAKESPSAGGGGIGNETAAAAAYGQAQTAALLQAIAAAPRAPATVAAPVNVAPSAGHTAEDRERALDTQVQEHTARLDAHDTETRDPSWSSDTESQIDSAWRNLPAGSETRYEGTDCRSRSCVIHLSWPSRASAQVAMASAVALSALPGCAQELTLPPGPANGTSARYYAAVFLDCGALRGIAAR